MHTHNEILIRAPVEDCLRAASDVERWPEILPHYRRVTFLRKDGPGRGRVEMAAVRRFGPLPWPVWWASEMETDHEANEVRYHHVDGITKGMDVVWRFEPRNEAGDPPLTRVVIVHDWEGPDWPVIHGIAARWVIGPRFVHVVADRTLEGIRRSLEEPGAAGAAA